MNLRKRPAIPDVALWLFAVALCSFSFPQRAFAVDSLCATVKIEIAQELTLERQAFDAHMRIRNGLTTLPLNDVLVTVNFTDKDGNPVASTTNPNPAPGSPEASAPFFIKLDPLENISAVDGSGSVAASTTADIHWLIIPAPGASKGAPQGTLESKYSATLRRCPESSCPASASPSPSC